MPCRDCHGFLAEAVASARNQTWEPKEIIIVDDGSTAPETAAALAALPGDVRVIRQENRGTAGARNRGVAESSGQYILPLDCDDRIEPDFAAKAFALIDGREDAFVYPWQARFGLQKWVLESYWDPFEQLVANQLPYCLLIPRSLWQRVGGQDERMRRGYEDWEFNIRLALSGAEGLCLAEPLFHYRIAANGMLLGTSRARHCELWRNIRRKHPRIYSLRGCLRCMSAWSARPRRRSAWKILALYFAYRLLPDVLCNILLDRLRRIRLRKSRAVPFAEMPGRP